MRRFSDFGRLTTDVIISLWLHFTAHTPTTQTT